MFDTTYTKIPAIWKRSDQKPHNVLFQVYNDPAVEFLKNCEWIFTEKVDGCLEYSTSVWMADGTKKRISAIAVGDVVLGMNEDGLVAPTPVRATRRLEKGGRWLNIRGTREAAGRGNSFFSLKCTDDHPLWSPVLGKYIPARDLEIGDRVLLLRSELGLTPIQNSVLTGKLLGDGSLVRSPSRSWAIEFGHTEKDSEYVHWTLRALGDIGHKKVGSRTSGYGSNIITGRSSFCNEIYEGFSHWWDNGRKVVPKNLCLDPIALAFWYMDDGSLSHSEGQEDRATIATSGFSRDDHDILLRELGSLGIAAVVFESRGHLALRFGSDDAEKLFLLVAPYIPGCMQRKLPERYRGAPGWLPEVNRTYKPALTLQTVTSIEEYEESVRFDIETSLGNFFANGVLVHNCNIRLDWDGYNLVFKGRSDNAQIPPALLAYLETRFDDGFVERLESEFGNTEVTLYGEGFGAGIQKGGGLYRKTPEFILFDVRVGEWWLERDNIVDIADKFDIQRVPVVARGRIMDGLVYVARGFNSVIADEERLAEGIVGVPAVPLYARNGKRIITKIKPEHVTYLMD